MLPSHNSCLTANVNGPAVKRVFCTTVIMSGRSFFAGSLEFRSQDANLESQTRWRAAQPLISPMRRRLSRSARLAEFQQVDIDRFTSGMRLAVPLIPRNADAIT